MCTREITERDGQNVKADSSHKLNTDDYAYGDSHVCPITDTTKVEYNMVPYFQDQAQLDQKQFD